MRTQRRKHDQEYGNFFANYIGQRSAYIEIDLNLNHLPLRQREEQAAKIAKEIGCTQLHIRPAGVSWDKLDKDSINFSLDQIDSCSA